MGNAGGHDGHSIYVYKPEEAQRTKKIKIIKKASMSEFFPNRRLSSVGRLNPELENGSERIPKLGESFGNQRRS